ncbi:MAG: insulinase family protein [Bacteroidales bacterium]|nr:insulinase family protein [Bacteroidales bacterium]
MINYQLHTLSNGLSLITHQDKSTPMVTVNLLYGVGARDEQPSHTGFAHLFEHLMFGGSEHVSNFDQHVNNAGGESNASTNNDFTNYYITVPAQYLETALWLESDRMRSPAFTPEVLRVQKQVVTEEYHQRYINQPYGDVWLHLRPLCYQVHPYRWCTIGSDIAHVQQATLDEVWAFFHTFYVPTNATLSIAGNIDHDRALQLAEKWFGDIAPGNPPQRNLPVEPPQNEPRSLTLHRNVPSNAIYMAFHICERTHPDFHTYDLLTDLLSNGKSSRMYNRLVKQSGLFIDADAYITGDVDPGLLIVGGKLTDGTDVDTACRALWDELNRLRDEAVPADELQKVIGKAESSFVQSQYKVADRAATLCYLHRIGHLEWINNELDRYTRITAADVQRTACSCLRPDNCSTLLYLQAH